MKTKFMFMLLLCYSGLYSQNVTSQQCFDYIIYSGDTLCLASTFVNYAHYEWRFWQIRGDGQGGYFFYNYDSSAAEFPCIATYYPTPDLITVCARNDDDPSRDPSSPVFSPQRCDTFTVKAFNYPDTIPPQNYCIDTLTACLGSTICFDNPYPYYDHYKWEQFKYLSAYCQSTSGEVNPCFEFTCPEYNIVRLTAWDDCSASWSVKDYIIYVYNQPTANFTFTPHTGCPPLKVDFTNTSTASADIEGSELTYLWDFGDGHTSTIQSPSHTYCCGGEYIITLTATQACLDTVTSAAFSPVEQVFIPTPDNILFKKYNCLPNGGGGGGCDYDICFMSPNPATDQVHIEYNIGQAKKAELEIVKTDNSFHRSYPLDINESRTEISLAGYPGGVFSVTLLADSRSIDNEKLIVIK